MRDGFVADVGDFAKYGLLRALCGFADGASDEKLSLGIVWYFVEDRGLSYRSDPERFQACDASLFHCLGRILNGNRRTIRAIADSDIFPADKTMFFPEPVPPNRRRREEWLDRALKKTRDCDLVFLDPDNGLATVPFGEGHISAKHAYYEELEPFLRRGQSLIAWHQPGFLKEAVPLRLAEIESRFPGYEIDALTFHRVVFRAFFMISGRKHKQLLAQRIARFLDGPWGEHFERVP